MADYKEGALSKKKDEKKDGGGKEKESHGGGGGGTSHRHPHMHIHSHDSGHTMHVMHHDGSHEMHHFAPGDTEGMNQVMAAHLGAPANPAGAPAPGGAEPAEHMAGGASPEQEQEEQPQAA